MRSVGSLHRHPTRAHDPHVDSRAAWLAVALVPVFLLLAFAVGEGIISGLGYPVGDVNPGWVTLLSDLGSVAVAALPCLAAALFGFRAARAGVRSAAVAAWIGILVGVAIVVMTLVTEIGNVT